MEGSEVILATFGKLFLLYFGVRVVIYFFNTFMKLTKGGF